MKVAFAPTAAEAFTGCEVIEGLDTGRLTLTSLEIVWPAALLTTTRNLYVRNSSFIVTVSVFVVTPL